MTETGKSVFVTKYALTSGIKQCEVSDNRPANEESVTVRWQGGLNGVAYFWGNDWHTTLEAAVTRANAMRDAKLASLHRRVERLKAMRF